MNDDEDEPDDIDFSPSAWQLPAPSAIAEAFTPRGLPVQNSDDLTRILNLPRRPPVVEGSTTALALIELAQQKYSRGLVECRCKELDPQRPTCITKLLWAQAWMLYETEVTGGLLAQASVGIGKTLCVVLAPLAMRNCRLALLLVPPTLLEQLALDYQLAAQHFFVPSLVVHLPGNKSKSWRATLRDGRDAPVLHVLPYSSLSSVRKSDWIDKLRPDLIIADECDALGALNSARTLRLLRYYKEHWQTTRFCGLTGSLSDSSITEYGHLAALALREGSPLPLDPMVSAEWGRCIDAVPNPAPPGALIRLLNPNEGVGLANVRRAFQRRVAETPGFIIIGGRQIITQEGGNGEEVELDIRERKAPPLPAIIEQVLGMLRQSIRPDTVLGSPDDEIVADPLELARYTREVASGVMSRYVFPRGEPKPLVMDWYGKRKRFHSEVRYKMLQGESQLDSPKLCEHAAMRAHGDAPRNAMLPEWKCDAWPAWRDIRDLVKPTREIHRLHPFLVEDACQWASKHKGVAWYLNIEFAEWCAELSGLPMHGGGTLAGEQLRRETGNRSIFVSLQSRGRGHNGLQFVFDEQLIAQTPSSAKRYEQLIGRMHRRGQRAPVVRTWVYLHTDELVTSFDQATRRAEYAEATLGAQQKLLEGWSGVIDDPKD